MVNEKILVTGAGGFIGFHVARRLLQNGRPVVGLDNLNDYYDPVLKEARVAELAKLPGFAFVKLDLADRAGVASLFAEHKFPGSCISRRRRAYAIRWSIRRPMS